MGGPWFAKKDAGAWSIPKGEYDEGEDPMAVAKREFNEELGKDVPEGELIELGTIEQTNKKLVVAWAVEGDLDVSDTSSNTFKIEWPPKSGQIQEFPEIDKAGWFRLSEAAEKLIPSQTKFLERLAAHLGVKYEPGTGAQQSELKLER